MKKLCIILANCQNLLLAEYLSRSPSFQKEYNIKRFPAHVLIKGKRTIPDRLLQRAKLFIYQPIKDRHGISSTKHILSRISPECRQISFPPLYFTGYHPQYCKNPQDRVVEPVYPFGIMPYGDINIISMLEKGKSIAEIIETLNDPDFYDRDFLLANVENSLAELARREASLNIKVSEFIKTHYRQHYLFHTINHPTDILGIYVVNQILQAIDLPKLEDNLFIDRPHRGVLDKKQIPIYPSTIANLQLSFIDENAVYRHDSFCTNRMTFTRYIKEYINLNQSNCQVTENYFNSIENINQGQLKSAEKSLKKAIEVRPNTPIYYRELATVLKQQGKYDPAIAVYKKAIELSPDWIEFYLSLGEVLLMKNDKYSAAKVYKQALNLDPTNDKICCQLGDISVDLNELKAAESLYIKAIELNPTKIVYYRCLGDVYYSQGNFELAFTTYQKAIGLAPENSWLYIKLAKTLAKQNKLDEAINVCKHSVNTDRQNPHFHRELGNILLQKGDIDSAFKAYERTIELNSNQASQVLQYINLSLKRRAVLQNV